MWSERNDKEAVQSILELMYNACDNVEPQNNDGDTPLGLALQSGCYEEISQVYQDMGIPYQDYLSNLTEEVSVGVKGTKKDAVRKSAVVGVKSRYRWSISAAA